MIVIAGFFLTCYPCTICNIRMKRSRFHQLDESHRRTNEIEDAIVHAQSDVVCEKNLKSREDVAAFVKQNTNYHMFVSPCLLPNERAIIFGCINTSVSIGLSIFQHFGPMELCVMTRVSKQTKELVTIVFLNLAPYYLDRYKEEVTSQQQLGRFNDDRVKLNRLIQLYIKELFHRNTSSRDVFHMESTNIPSIEHLLALWYRLYRFYREHGKRTRPMNEHYRLCYLFVVDLRSGRFIPMSHINVYHSDRVTIFKHEIITEWFERYGFKFPVNKVPFDLVRTRHIEKMKLAPVGDQFTRIDHLFVVEDDRIIPFDSSLYIVHYCVPPPESFFSVRRPPPFIDHYEQLMNLRRGGPSVFTFNEIISRHIDRFIQMCQ